MNDTIKSRLRRYLEDRAAGGVHQRVALEQLVEVLDHPQLAAPLPGCGGRNRTQLRGVPAQFREAGTHLRAHGGEALERVQVVEVGELVAVGFELLAAGGVVGERGGQPCTVDG